MTDRTTTHEGASIMTKLTLWQQHCEQWGKGCGSDQCEDARHVVLARGTVPCDVLFIGEAPGEGEDVLGRPFVGPAGKLLDEIIARALDSYRTAPLVTQNIRLAYTNLVGCIPRNEDTQKADEPELQQIRQCRPRLLDFIRVADGVGPANGSLADGSLRLIVCVGTFAEKHLPPRKKSDGDLHRPIPTINVTHPAAILRASVIHKGLMSQKAEVVLLSAFEEYLL